jgi:hypothetical protein
MPFAQTFHHHFQHPSVPPNAGKWGSGVPALTMEQIEELFPDWQLQFQQHAEDAGYPSEHWPDKSLWSKLLPRYVAGYDEMWILTTLPFNPQGTAPEPGLLAKAAPTVMRMYDSQMGVFRTSGTAAFLPMQGPKVEGWWEHGSILIKDTATLFLACVAQSAMTAHSVEVREEVLASLQEKRRGRPPAKGKVETTAPKTKEADAAKLAEDARREELRVRYLAWLAECERLKGERDALVKTHRQEVKELYARHALEREALRAPERPE